MLICISSIPGLTVPLVHVSCMSGCVLFRAAVFWAVLVMLQELEVFLFLVRLFIVSLKILYQYAAVLSNLW